MKEVEISQKLDKLIELMARVAEALEGYRTKGSTEVKNIETVPKVVSADKQMVTIEQIRDILKEKTLGGKEKEVQELIVRYGGKKLSEIQQERFEELIKEASKL